MSTRIMKKPMHSAQSAGQGFTPASASVEAPVGLWVWVTGTVNTRAWTISPMSFDASGDLLAGPPPTELPEDPAAAELAAGDATADVVRRHPESPLAWATLAESALADDAVDDVTAYAYARVGYHRSLDLLRRNGWAGHGPVPWSHEPNRGFLRALAALTRAAGRIGESAEEERCGEFLRDSSPEGYAELLG